MLRTIEDQREAMGVGLASPAAKSKVRAQFQRHIEARQSGIFIWFDPGYIVNCEIACTKQI